MFSKTEWEQIRSIGAEKDGTFDWDIPSGYIVFGANGMTAHKLFKQQWYEKHVNNWRDYDYREINLALKEKDWQPTF